MYRGCYKTKDSWGTSRSSNLKQNTKVIAQSHMPKVSGCWEANYSRTVRALIWTAMVFGRTPEQVKAPISSIEATRQKHCKAIAVHSKTYMVFSHGTIKVPFNSLDRRPTFQTSQSLIYLVKVTKTALKVPKWYQSKQIINQHTDHMEVKSQFHTSDL